MASFLFIEFQSRQPQELSPPRAVLIMCHKAYLAEKGITRWKCLTLNKLTRWKFDFVKKVILESSSELKKETTQNKIINDTFYSNLFKTIFEWTV